MSSRSAAARPCASAARRLHALEILRDRRAQLALAPGVKGAEALELRGDRTRIENGRGPARGMNRRIGMVGRDGHRRIRISEPSRHVTEGVRGMFADAFGQRISRGQALGSSRFTLPSPLVGEG